ncbi:MAG: O-antigen ligase domain-containing protein, partial [Caldilineae bacterium]
MVRFWRRVAWLEPFWVLALGVVLLVPARFLPGGLEPYLSRATPYAIGGLLLGWPVRWLAYRRFSVRTPLDWSLGLILLWLPVTFWASADKTLSWQALGYMAVGLGLYFALINWPPAQERPLWVGAALLGVAVLLALAAPLLSQFALSKLFRLGQLNPIFQRLADLTPGNVNANVMAGALVVVWPLWAGLALRPEWAKRRWWSWLCGVVAVGMLGVLFLTQSRGAYLAAAAGLGVLFLMRWPKLVYALPVAALAVAFAVVRIGPDAILNQVTSGAAAQSALNSLEGRLELWSRALYAIQDFSFTGIGIGTFQVVIPLLYPYFLISPSTTITHAHNLFLQVAVDWGIPGLIAYLALHINVFVM